MKGQKRDIVFSLLLVAVSSFLFFSLGLFAADKLGFVTEQVIKIEYQETEPTETTTTTVTVLVNLNTATVEELMQIDGIGEKTAQKIINYRNEIGRYTFIEQLLDVEGVGEKKLESWKPYLTLGSDVTTTQTTAKTKININIATKEELMRISGIGEQTALKIIAYREEIGGFTHLEQLLDIEGIGENKFNAWKDYLTI